MSSTNDARARAIFELGAGAADLGREDPSVGDAHEPVDPAGTAIDVGLLVGEDDPYVCQGVFLADVAAALIRSG